MKLHVKSFMFSVCEFFESIFRDLKSFRNKLTVFMCTLTVICVYKYLDNPVVIVTALGMLDSYLIYYLHNRKKQDDLTSTKKAPKK